MSTEPVCRKTGAHRVESVRRGLGFSIPESFYVRTPTAEETLRWHEEQERARAAYEEHLKVATACIGCGESPTVFVCRHCQACYCSPQCAESRYKLV